MRPLYTGGMSGDRLRGGSFGSDQKRRGAVNPETGGCPGIFENKERRKLERVRKFIPAICTL